MEAAELELLFPFQSTPLMRGETLEPAEKVEMPLPFQSTPLMRGETTYPVVLPLNDIISIHSPHARGDDKTRARRPSLRFQSTPLMRGETQTIWADENAIFYFNPLPSCEGRPADMVAFYEATQFQSTPLMRGETGAPDHGCRETTFQSTPLMRGETDSLTIPTSVDRISIHSPHARGDICYAQICINIAYFNPLPSCEGRQHKPLKIRLDSRQFIQQNHHSSFF